MIKNKIIFKKKRAYACAGSKDATGTKNRKKTETQETRVHTTRKEKKKKAFWCVPEMSNG